MHGAHLFLTKKAVALGAGALLMGGAGYFGTVGGHHGGPVAMVTASASLNAAPPPPMVPAGEPELATDWVTTGDRRVAVLFFYHREETGCAGPCERYGMTLRFQEPAAGPEPSSDWHQVAVAACEHYLADGAPDDICVSVDPLAGRDRHGNDYVLAPFSVTRGQLARMYGARTVDVQIGSLRLRLARDAHDVLRGFLGSAGRATPR